MENVIKPYFEGHLDMHIHRMMTIEIEDQEFYVKYARPFFGKVSNGTQVKIDSGAPKRLQSIRIAPIWESDTEQHESEKNRSATAVYLKKHYLEPYFLGSFMCFVEKGETIMIGNREFFVNDCKPKNGIVDAQTVLETETGFTQEVFKKKQVLADKRFAEKL